MDKKSIRKLMSSKRNSFTKEEVLFKSKQIFLNLLNIKEFNEASQVLCFINIKNEVATSKIIEYFWQNNKKTAAPKVIDNEMEFYYFSSKKELIKGYFDIPEPVNIKENNKYVSSEKDVIIIPGLAFDKFGGRVGYGGGFYDKYLSKNPNLIKIAIAYDFQVLEFKLETFEHDIKPDYLITENRIHKLNFKNCYFS